MGSDESHFNVSVGRDGRSHKTVSTNHNLFEEKGEPKRYRTEVLPLTSLTPYRQAKPVHVQYSSDLLPFNRSFVAMRRGITPRNCVTVLYFPVKISVLLLFCFRFFKPMCVN